MTECRFYHLTRATAAQALPDLLEKTLARGWRAVVRLGDDASVEEMAEHLWTYRSDSFLPHGTKKDGAAEDQPLWLTSGEDNPNGATVLFLVNAEKGSAEEGYELVCDLFDGNDAALIDAARARFKERKGRGHAVTYWQQGDKGWQQKGGA